MDDLAKAKPSPLGADSATDDRVHDADVAATPFGVGDGDDSPPSLARRLLDVKTLISFAVAIAILVLMLSRVEVDFGGTIRAVSTANVSLLALGLLVFYLILPIRALRWRQMLGNAGVPRAECASLPRLTSIILVSLFANCLVPAKLGDVYRAYLLKSHTGISGTKAGGTIVAERLLDLATLLLLGGIAAFVSLHGRPSETYQGLLFPAEVAAGLIVLAAVVLLAMRTWSPHVRRLIPHRLRGTYARFEEGATGSFGNFHILLPLTVVGWLCEALRLLFVTRSVGLVLSPEPVLEVSMVVAVALLGSFLTALPLTPAGLGFVETGLVGALILVGVKDQSLAVTVALLDRSISYVSVVILGLLAYVVSEHTMRSRKPAVRSIEDG